MRLLPVAVAVLTLGAPFAVHAASPARLVAPTQPKRTKLRATVTATATSRENYAGIDSHGRKVDIEAAPDETVTIARQLESEDADTTLPFAEATTRATRWSPPVFTSLGAHSSRRSVDLAAYPEVKTLQVHAPIQVVATGPDGSARRLVTNVRGAPAGDRIELPRGTGFRQSGGKYAPHDLPWAHLPNLLVTPLHVRGRQGPLARVVGLAAFPIGTRVRARLGDFDVEKEITERPFELTVPTTDPSAKLHLLVYYPMTGEVPARTPAGTLLPWQAAAREAKMELELRLPSPAHPDVVAGGVRYYPASVGGVQIVRAPVMSKHE